MCRSSNRSVRRRERVRQNIHSSNVHVTECEKCCGNIAVCKTRSVKNGLTAICPYRRNQNGIRRADNRKARILKNDIYACRRKSIVNIDRANFVKRFIWSERENVNLNCYRRCRICAISGPYNRNRNACGWKLQRSAIANLCALKLYSGSKLQRLPNRQYGYRCGHLPIIIVRKEVWNCHAYRRYAEVSVWTYCKHSIKIEYHIPICCHVKWRG